MEILLTIRSEMICIIILLFLLIYSKVYSETEEKKRFLRICFFALCHVIFACITEYTVNHLDTIPYWENGVFHIVFYIFAILFCYEFSCYVIHITINKELAGKITRFMLIPPVLFVAMMPFLRIDYVAGRGTNYSYGPCVFVGYGTAMVLLLWSFAVMLVNFRRIEKKVIVPLFPMVVFMVVTICIQAVVPEFLFTGGGVTLVTVGTYFAIENPAKTFREKALIDVATSVRSKNSYHEDIDRLGMDPTKRPIACVMTDLNNLKQINDQFGHMVGDELIRLASQVLMTHLKSAYNIYRMGGDEFVAVYVNANEELVASEVDAARRDCRTRHTSNGCRLSMAFGYAISVGDEYVTDTVDRADRKMYEEKIRMKQEEKETEYDL